MNPFRRRSRRGSAAVEFALCATFLIPLMLGAVSIGLSLNRTIQATQVGRDAGHMYVRFVDFSLPANQDVVVRVARGLGMTRDGGQGVVILTRIKFIGEVQCAEGGLTPAQCPNYNRPVITQRLTIGNPGLRPSSFGTPNPPILGAKGEIAIADYLTHGSAVAQGFESRLALLPGELAYVSEAFFLTSGLRLGWWGGPGVYSRTIF
jgi:hypothetical protein